MSGKKERTGRIEDDRLVRGHGHYLDDLHLPGTLEVAFLRSTEAHARIIGWDPTEALAVPGVEAIYRLDDLRVALTQDRLPLQFLDQLPSNITPFVLAHTEVVYVGEPIALVVASSRYVAEDAVSRISIDYDPLPVIGSWGAAMASGAPLVASDRSSNIVAELRQSYGDINAAFGKAEGTVRLTLSQHRGGSHPLEGRGVLANRDPMLGGLTLWASSQLAHELRSALTQMLGLDEDRLRVLTPDVGGGFGSKYLIYAEDVAVAAAALILGKPLKWTEDRREHFLAAVQERDQDWELEVCYDKDGRVLGARGCLIHDQGAYTPQGISVPFNSATAFPGPYVLPSLDLRIYAVSTNKVPTSSVRGSGYPQGTFAMERALDRIADTLGISRIEIRRRNLVPSERMPYASPLKSRSGSPIVYDSGDYPKMLEAALESIEFDGFVARQTRARSAGKLLGLGVSCGIKGTGRGPYESGTVRISRSGTISVYTGASEMGQGIRDTLAQICAKQFNVEPTSISVIAGDTAVVPLGMGGFASRQAVTAGSSVYLAASNVRRKVLQIASELLEVAEDDLEIADGGVFVKGASGLKLTLQQVAGAVYGSPGYALPPGIGPGLESAETFEPKGLTYGMSCHAVEVELDEVTCAPKITRYIVVNDAGVIINPTIVEGQIVGGVVHGIGNALYERMSFSDNGQPVTTTFAEYLLTTSTEVPRITVRPLSYPATTNPIGVKGVGECGVVPAVAAIVSAIENAVGHPGLQITTVPISPDQLFQLMQQTKAG